MRLSSKLTRVLAILICLPLLAARGHDIRFSTGKSAECIPFDAGNRHVAFNARINGRDGMWLVLDSGAGAMVIDAARAEAFGLKQRGEHEARGSGGIEMGGFVKGVDVTLPGLQLIDQRMHALPLGSLSAQAGRPMDAILGYPLFAKCVVAIDYAKRCVSLYDAASYRYTGSGVSVPLSFIDNTPYVDARVVLPDGRSMDGKFVIDTGASSNVMLSPDSKGSEGLLASLGKTMTVQSHGVGGASSVRMARVAALELGGFSLTQPVAGLYPAGTGRISAAGTVGNIGGGVLNRFKVIFDYPRRRMILEPGPNFAEPFEADMSGLGVAAIPPDLKRFTVARVQEGSPAEEAGIRAGDEIESVNGKPPEEIGLSALREQLRREGQDVQLTLLRNGDRLTRALKTRRMI